MAQIKNGFNKAVINTDTDERFVENGTLLDATNCLVSITDGGNSGVIKNVLGNLKVTNNNFNTAKVVGVGKNESKNKCYYMVKALDYDYLMEYDTVTGANVKVLQSTTGTRLNLKNLERVHNIEIFNDPENNGDLILWSGDTNPPRIGNVERMKTWGTDGFTQEEIMVIKKPPTYAPLLSGKISTENSQANYLENKFLCFCYRYKYKDGYYSVVSAFTKYFFAPNPYKLDFETFENLGMVNTNNAVDLTFNTGEREVIGVDLLFKLSNDTTIYVIDKFIKEDESWADNQSITIEFNNSKVYSVLPPDQYHGSFDNVPEMVFAQARIGNRISYANFVEGKDLIDKNGQKSLMDYQASHYLCRNKPKSRIQYRCIVCLLGNSHSVGHKLRLYD